MEESVERMDFITFNCLFMQYSKKLISHTDISIYAPLVYMMKDEYFNAVVNYLRTGKTENLVYGKFSTNEIMQCYRDDDPDYIQAVIILDNIEKCGDHAYDIFNPYIVE